MYLILTKLFAEVPVISVDVEKSIEGVKESTPEKLGDNNTPAKTDSDPQSNIHFRRKVKTIDLSTFSVILNSF